MIIFFILQTLISDSGGGGGYCKAKRDVSLSEGLNLYALGTRVDEKHIIWLPLTFNIRKNRRREGTIQSKCE